MKSICSTSTASKASAAAKKYPTESSIWERKPEKLKKPSGMPSANPCVTDVAMKRYGMNRSFADSR